MTEELKQEAKEWIKDHSGLIGSYEYVKYDYDSMQKAYLAGATEATKELRKQNTNLQTMLQAEREVRCNEEYLKKVTELEAQIEKMKLCANCKHCGVSGWCDKLNRYLLDKANQSCGNWEIKEK